MPNDYFYPDEVRSPRGFYLVQRIKHSPWRANKAKGCRSPLLKGNPFGYGQLGEYDLDYMGSAEFEWGAIPAAYDRFAAAKELTAETFEYDGVNLFALYITAEGAPHDAFRKWAVGDEHHQPFYGKERPYDFEAKLKVANGTASEWDVKSAEYGGDIWWSLGTNVQWCFADDTGDDGLNHIERLLATIGEHTETNALRG